MANNLGRDPILFGSGDLFIVTKDEESGEEIETKVGESSAESSLNIENENIDVRGGRGHNILASFQTGNTVTFNAGIVTFNLEHIGKFLASQYSEDEEKGIRKLEISNQYTVKVHHLRFVHYKKEHDGKKLTLDMYSAKPTQNLEWMLNAEEASPFSFEFRLLQDPDQKNIVEITEEM